jgi:hypothetical protein
VKYYYTGGPFYLKEEDETPNTVKIARWVWCMGKDGDNIKVLLIAIKLKGLVSGRRN